jgi:hypothetical protein
MRRLPSEGFTKERQEVKEVRRHGRRCSRPGKTKEVSMGWTLGLLLFTVGINMTSADAPREWKEFASKEGRFKVLMPGTPKKEKAETESDFGKGVLHMNTVQAGKTMYGANYCDFPAKIKKVSLKQILDSSRDGAVANLEGKLASEKDIKLGKYTGREIRINVAGGKQLFRARVYLVEQRLYQVVVFGTREAATSKEADKFLDSFKLTEK